MENARERAEGAFRASFGRGPAWGAGAPGRVNLIGEHTDYNEGLVLPMAIDRMCIALGAPAAHPARSRILAADLDQSAELDLRRPLESGDKTGQVSRGSWLGYFAGVAAGFQRRGGRGGPANMDVVVASDLPIGGGLASSAALEVAVATLMEQATFALDPKAKALLCQRAEHEFAGVPCGIMDQFVSVMGRAGHALLIDCRSQEATPIRMPPAERMAVVVINSNVRHAHAGGEYAARRMACESAAQVLGVAALRDADMGLLESARERLSEVEFRRVRHVVTENARVLATVEAFRSGTLSHAGRLMRESHESLRSDFEVSCAELDTLVGAASASPGVIGARMTGGGFGGCVVAMLEPGAVRSALSDIQEGFRRAHGMECAVYPVRVSDGAAQLG